MAREVTLIPGDGTGPEIVAAARRVIDATGVKIEWDVQDAGVDVMEKYGTPLPDGVIESVKRTKVGLKGPITTPVGTGFRSVNVAIRHALSLYCCLRPAKSYEGVRTRYQNIDIVIMRENIEDLYAGIEFEEGKQETYKLIDHLSKLAGKQILPDSGIGIKPISVTNTKKIVNFSFNYARKYNRKQVWAVHKANIQKYTDGLFLKVAREVAKNYPDIKFDDRIVDNMCMQLVQRPEESDILVLPNLYGDILSDLCAGLIGGLGVAPGANIGDDYAVFEAIHGSAPKYTGQNKVDPTAVILSGMLMLQHLGEMDAAARLEKAVADVIREGKHVTYNYKADRNDPTAVGTSQMADAMIRKLEGKE
ncbi:MAG: isocitrate/isopropylmalate dehydrogenase family protein [Chloroflexi bacterium]|nr:isocitrate/isopropylmalate dehydrogenase family protein [Chloroflexota bacterium]